MKTILERSTILSHYAAMNLAFFGAMQGGMDSVLEMIAAITTQCKNTDELDSWLLDSVAGSIVSAKRTPNKKDADLRSELLSITQRGAAKKWNTAKAGVEFLRYYFPDTNNPANIWGLYPLLYENLVQNHSFDKQTATDWKLTLAAIITNTPGITTFRGATIAALAPKGSIAQTMKIVHGGLYALRFAHYGSALRVSIYDKNGLYWKAQSGEKDGLPVGGWHNAAHYRDIAKCSDWSVHTLFFRADPKIDRSVTIQIEVPTGKGIERRNLYPQLQISSTTAYGAAYRGGAYRDGPSPKTTGSLPSVAALVDDVHLGRYRSPGLQYMVRLPQNKIGKPGGVRNLYDGAVSRSGDSSAAYRNQTFREGYSVRAYSEAAKRDWLKIISAAGVPAKIDIFGGLS